MQSINLPRFEMASSVIAVNLLIFLQASAQDSKQPPVDTPPHVFLGYCMAGDAETPPAGIDYSRFTHLCRAFLTHTDNGELAVADSTAERNMTASAHQSGVRVLISAGHDFTALAGNRAATNRYVAGLMKVIVEHDYDGVDLDWEHPGNAEERDLHAAFLRRLRRELDVLGRQRRRRYELTAAVVPNQWLNVEAMNETLDFVNVMCYDMSGSWPAASAGHNSPLFPTSKDPSRGSTSAHMQWWVDRGVPKRKLIVGLPLYGWMFSNFEIGEQVGEAKPPKHVGSLAYRGLPALIAQGWIREEDKEGRAPWFWSADRTRFIGMDDPKSIAEKSKWARDEGYRGVFFWQVAHDRMPDDAHPLLNAAAQVWPLPRDQ